RLYISNNDVQVRDYFLTFVDGTKGARVTVTNNDVQFQTHTNGFQTYLVTNNAPETVSGWTISGNNYAAAGVNIPSPVLLNNITLDTVGKLVDGDSHSGTYTPTVTGVANIDT